MRRFGRELSCVALAVISTGCTAPEVSQSKSTSFGDLALLEDAVTDPDRLSFDIERPNGSRSRIVASVECPPHQDPYLKSTEFGVQGGIHHIQGRGATGRVALAGDDTYYYYETGCVKGRNSEPEVMAANAFGPETHSEVVRLRRTAPRQQNRTFVLDQEGNLSIYTQVGDEEWDKTDEFYIN